MNWSLNILVEKQNLGDVRDLKLPYNYDIRLDAELAIQVWKPVF